MNNTNNVNPLESLQSIENRLRELPLNAVSPTVYKRLQAKAAWNMQPVIPRIMLTVLITLCAGIIIFTIIHIFAHTNHKIDAETKKEIQEILPITPPKSPPLIVQSHQQKFRKSSKEEGLSILDSIGLSALMAYNEPKFAVRFGPLMTCRTYNKLNFSL